jgi:hypothetical protein
VIEYLTQIGFQDLEDPATHLHATDVPIAKVFVVVFLHDTDLQRLPWEAGRSGPPMLLVQTAMEVGKLMAGDDPGIDTHQFGQREHVEVFVTRGRYKQRGQSSFGIN